MEDPELTDFWQLLGYRAATTPEIQRAALAAGVFYPCELYCRAPDDVRDALITALPEGKTDTEVVQETLDKWRSDPTGLRCRGWPVERSSSISGAVAD